MLIGNLSEVAVVCNAPAATAAGALSESYLLANLTFEPDELVSVVGAYGSETARYHLYGDAFFARELRLTSDVPGQRGACILAGGPTHGADTTISASFDLRIGGWCDEDGVASESCGAAGLSFVFGELAAEVFGEGGAGDGLRLSFRTSPARLFTASYAGTEIASTPLNESLRAGYPRRVEVRYVHDGLWVSSTAHPFL